LGILNIEILLFIYYEINFYVYYFEKFVIYNLINIHEESREEEICRYFKTMQARRISLEKVKFEMAKEVLYLCVGWKILFVL